MSESPTKPGTNTSDATASSKNQSDQQAVEQTDQQVSELDSLRAERDALKKSLTDIEQKDLSETEKEKKALEKELHDLAKQKVLDSKLFKDKELESFDYKQLRAIGIAIDKFKLNGNKIAPSRTPESEDNKINKIVRGYTADKKPIY